MIITFLKKFSFNSFKKIHKNFYERFKNGGPFTSYQINGTFYKLLRRIYSKFSTAPTYLNVTESFVFLINYEHLLSLCLSIFVSPWEKLNFCLKFNYDSPLSVMLKMTKFGSIFSNGYVYQNRNKSVQANLIHKTYSVLAGPFFDKESP